jgi:hypothetical protein
MSFQIIIKHNPENEKGYIRLRRFRKYKLNLGRKKLTVMSEKMCMKNKLREENNGK